MKKDVDSIMLDELFEIKQRQNNIVDKIEKLEEEYQKLNSRTVTLFSEFKTTDDCVYQNKLFKFTGMDVDIIDINVIPDEIK